MRVAIYGRSGSGKTTLASTFPAPLLLDINQEEGTDSVADVKDLKVLSIDEWDDIEQTYWYLAETKHGFKTVIVDTVTQMQELAIGEVSGRKKVKAEKFGGWGTLTRQEWGDAAGMMKVWITHFRNLPFNVVFLAQERVFGGGDEADDAEGQIAPEVGPRLMPSVRSTLDASVDIIGNSFIRSSVRQSRTNGKITQVRRMQYCLRVGPHVSYITKVRKPKGIEAPAFLIDPTYEDLLELRTGEEG